MTALFLHGVPDTPALWRPLLDALDLPANETIVPALPGFTAPAPRGFSSTKEEYLSWLTELVEAQVASTGPIDLVGHDWGAALIMRLASLKPELVRSWTVMNAVLEPGYRWHKTARIWQTPIYGEIFMAMARPARLEVMLSEAGMPTDLAKIEASHVRRPMKRSILRLYRSAKTMSDEWTTHLANLPERGLIVWGVTDPFVQISVAERFCANRGFELHREEGAGHWAVCERPQSIAQRLQAHWA